jgi:hypothetical protein
MRRLLAFVVVLVFSLPAGLSVVGCGHNPNNYCIKNGHTYGIKTDQVVYITLGPEETGLSLAWGQTGTLGSPQAYNCNLESASVSHYTYASSNLLLADISPTGVVCAGTWNRNSPGGVPDFSICTPPAGASLSGFQGCTSSTCGTAQLTASGAAVTSNPVNVYIHPPISSITIPAQSACISQGQALQNSLLSETTVTGPGGVTLCSPGTLSCTDPRANVGTITYNPVTQNVVTIDNTSNPASSTPGTAPLPNPNGLATANLPGSTVINATSSQVTSAAGFFSTCPPKNISLTINGSTSATVTSSSPQTIVSSVTDTAGNPINGLALTYASTEPQNLTVSNTGLVSETFPSHATVSAICQPPGCNPAPVNLIGNLGNGMPVAGNLVNINSPGRSSNKIWFASAQSPFFSSIDLTTGGPGVPIRLPFTPNSMVMDQAGDTLFFGSYHELMMYSTVQNTLGKEIPSVPGVVLAVSPTGSTVVINDQLRGVIYLYSTNAGTYTSIAGMAYRAQYSPDGTTVYVAGVNPATNQNTLFVNNSGTGWSTYPLNNQPAYSCPLEATGTTAAPAYNPAWDPFCGPGLTITVPSVAAFLTGNTTAAHSYCPNQSATPPYYPPGGDVGGNTTELTATADGFHVLGAGGATFSDIWLAHNDSSGTRVPGAPVGACPAYSGPPLTLDTTPTTGTLPVTPTEIDQIVSSPDSSVAFVTYTEASASGVLPYYKPSASAFAFGTLGSVQLSSGAQAPVAGAFSPDGSIFFTSTSGDNLVHMVSTSSLTDTQTLNPNLTNGSGAGVPAQFMAVKSRPTT